MDTPQEEVKSTYKPIPEKAAAPTKTLQSPDEITIAKLRKKVDGYEKILNSALKIVACFCEENEKIHGKVPCYACDKKAQLINEIESLKKS